MAKRTVKLLGEPIQNEDDKAGEAIIPGHLMTLNGSGDWIKHNVTTAAAAGLKVPAIFAMEREEMGQDIDDAYATGDTVKAATFGPGCRVNAIIGVVNATKGALLESAGNGTLRLVTTGYAVARSLEILNNGAGTARLRVEII
jgi:hypothetical protein